MRADNRGDKPVGVRPFSMVVAEVVTGQKPLGVRKLPRANGAPVTFRGSWPQAGERGTSAIWVSVPLRLPQSNLFPVIVHMPK